MQFIDSKSQNWDYKITNRVVREISRRTGVNLVNIALAESNLNSLFDMLFVNEALFVCCHKQADQRSVSFEDFEELLEVDYFPEIHDGFLKAIENFFLRTGQKAIASAVKEARKQFSKLSMNVMEELKTDTDSTPEATPTTSP